MTKTAREVLFAMASFKTKRIAKGTTGGVAPVNHISDESWNAVYVAIMPLNEIMRMMKNKNKTQI